MKIKILLVLLIVCFLLCSCGNNQQSQSTTDDITTTTTESPEVTTTENNNVQDTQDDSDDIPSLFVTTEPETTINLDDLFNEIIGDSFPSIVLPDDVFEDGSCTPPVPVTTVPTTSDDTVTEPPVEVTTGAPNYNDMDVLPEDTWDD